MPSPHQPDDTDAGDRTDSTPVSDDSAERRPQVLKLRIVPWDVICTLAGLGVLLIVVSMTSWPERLFAFSDSVCTEEDCAPVPYGINYYIFPVMWGGIGAAVSAAVLGPFVSMLKGWFMSFWPVLSVAILTLTSILGYALTGYSSTYWH
jgi:hypothetical protein